MPTLSVIVTFDATEPHLRSCLDSISRQTLSAQQTEIILVPVWSTPQQCPSFGEETASSAASAIPAGDDADEDSEATDAARAEGLAVATEAGACLPNGAPLTLDRKGATSHIQARVRGARRATGDYLAFLVGSDAVTSYAYELLLDSLGHSGSDIAAGGVYRFNELGSRASRAHAKIFTRTRTATHARLTTALTGDRLFGNKVWRRSFWDTLPPAPDDDTTADLFVVAAHFAAAAVDTRHAPVYLWRDAQTTPDLSDTATLTARLSAMAALAASLPASDRAVWDGVALRRDIRHILLRLDDTDAAGRERFLELTNAYLDAVDRTVLDHLEALHRLNYYLVRKRHLAALLETLTFQKSVELKNAPVVRRGMHYYVNYPFFESSAPAGGESDVEPAAGHVRVPREIYRIDSELRVRQKTERVEWRDGRLVVAGRVGLHHLRPRRRWQQHLLAFAVNTTTRRRIPVPVKVRRAAEYRLPDVADAARHDYGGFEISVDPAKLRLGGQWHDTSWKLELVILNRGFVRRRIVANPVSGPPERPPYQRVSGGDDDNEGTSNAVWIRPSWDSHGHLNIAVESLLARVSGYRIDHAPSGAHLCIEGELVAPPAAEATTLRLTRLPGTASLDYSLDITGARFLTRIPVAGLLAHALNEGGGALRQEQWNVRLHTPDGTDLRLVLPDEIAAESHPAGDGHHEVAVMRTSSGHLRLRAGWARPVIHSAAWSGRQLVLTGTYAAAAQFSLVLKARGREERHVVPVERDGHDFRAVWAPAAVETLSGPLPLSAGNYELRARVHLDGGAGSGASGEAGAETTEIGADLASGFVWQLPLPMETPERTFSFADTGFDTPVLKVSSDLRDDERGSYAQRRLRQEHYPAQRHEPLREEILFDSYTGRQLSDSPHAIYAQLRADGGAWGDYPMSWLVRDGQLNLPDDLTKVRHNGREFYESLARSRYIVTNSRQPAWFHRRPEQTVVQTWHGSMLKRIGFDIENIRGKSRDYHEKLAWETQQWDYLVSPSPWATPILRRAFRFEGEILETGYPRNDIFFSPHRHEVAQRVRRQLGLPADKKVILYAPTWRDDKYYTRGRHKLDLHLDLHRMYDKLGEDHVLLVRRHPRVVDSVPVVGRDFVYDVSLYPEVMELFLLTDILITDYSSMMFDFANTGRPMLFFTYDIDSYRDNLRGFYFDFEETAPGPLLRESDDVIAAILGIDDVARAHARRYQDFVDTFCPLDDGHAAARVVERVFGRRAAPPAGSQGAARLATETE
ncbi:bifunctional glycosyltransferase/CDP-glycerol:glycerophosphate glycerophosphotransferase [Salinactinospora qingdaonensis]|uniref:CDP-glycerol glycerophosphotransferase n=1 Tax=Salinactinospora qingdaonensis TaxID=702744 RepID=A0ABP7FVP5_9ACTN